MQHGNCVVELANLDLRKEKEGGKAGAEQHVAKGVGAGGTQGSTQQIFTRGLTDCAGTASRAAREAGLCLSLPDLGTLCASREPNSLPVLWGMPRPHPAGCDAAVVPIPGPPQGFGGRTAAPLMAPLYLPRRDSPFLESPWHRTRLPVLLLIENHFH